MATLRDVMVDAGIKTSLLEIKAGGPGSGRRPEGGRSIRDVAKRWGYKQVGQQSFKHPEGHQIFTHDADSHDASWSHYHDKPFAESRYLSPATRDKNAKLVYQRIGWGGGEELDKHLSKVHGK